MLVVPFAVIARTLQLGKPEATLIYITRKKETQLELGNYSPVVPAAVSFLSQYIVLDNVNELIIEKCDPIT